MTQLSALQARVIDLEHTVMSDSEGLDAEGEVVDSSGSSSLTDLDPIENMVAIPAPGPLQIHTLVPVEVPLEFVPPALWETPLPEYIEDCAEDLAHDGVLEYFVDLDV